MVDSDGVLIAYGPAFADKSEYCKTQIENSLSINIENVSEWETDWTVREQIPDWEDYNLIRNEG